MRRCMSDRNHVSGVLVDLASLAGVRLASKQGERTGRAVPDGLSATVSGAAGKTTRSESRR